ncbi:LATS1 isoform 6, partial [Pongo abelii]
VKGRARSSRPPRRAALARGSPAVPLPALPHQGYLGLLGRAPAASASALRPVAAVQELCSSLQDMVIQALQKTNNRSIEAAIEFISKMSYQDPRREQMAAAAARPINASMKPGNVQQSVNRKQSWKGSKESLVPQRHGPPLGESVAYHSESPNSQTDVGRPLSGSGISAFVQAHPSNGQRVNPPPPPQVRSVTPPPPPRGQT